MAARKAASVGDSITFGARIKNGEANCCPAQLAAMLGGKAKVEDFWVNGATLLKKSKQPYWSLKQHKAPLAFQPDVVVRAAQGLVSLLSQSPFRSAPTNMVALP